MTIYATCGHEIPADSESEQNTVVVARRNREGRPVLSYETACASCERKMSDSACIPVSEDDFRAVLDGRWQGGYW